MRLRIVNIFIVDLVNIFLLIFTKNQARYTYKRYSIQFLVFELN